jgi:hypothetical protein
MPAIHTSKPRKNAWVNIHQKRLLDKGKIEKLVVAAPRSIDS